jgi:steroid 5-alpha reductase family enzyme
LVQSAGLVGGFAALARRVLVCVLLALRTNRFAIGQWVGEEPTLASVMFRVACIALSVVLNLLVALVGVAVAVREAAVALLIEIWGVTHVGGMDRRRRAKGSHLCRGQVMPV